MNYRRQTSSIWQGGQQPTNLLATATSPLLKVALATSGWCKELSSIKGHRSIGCGGRGGGGSEVPSTKKFGASI